MGGSIITAAREVYAVAGLKVVSSIVFPLVRFFSAGAWLRALNCCAVPGVIDAPMLLNAVERRSVAEMAPVGCDRMPLAVPDEDDL